MVNSQCRVVEVYKFEARRGDQFAANRSFHFAGHFSATRCRLIYLLPQTVISGISELLSDSHTQQGFCYFLLCSIKDFQTSVLLILWAA